MYCHNLIKVTPKSITIRSDKSEEQSEEKPIEVEHPYEQESIPLVYK